MERLRFEGARDRAVDARAFGCEHRFVHDRTNDLVSEDEALGDPRIFGEERGIACGAQRLESVASRDARDGREIFERERASECGRDLDRARVPRIDRPQSLARRVFRAAR